ncbi:SMP-30/gluconolactonase/LRE family protein [Siccationidurans ginsengisoli]|uniref:SMP-30/gluconolactonase/LRE family protein n=1 Tax=Hymenobacter TaxID=89966 RepID=UPI001AAC48FD|nr:MULTISPECIES: SMP-30/gluconolactonase/LRE family protein [unclassified Hymenobacter]MBO2030643.1 SMP-30/gluconolactonase/LRE family protein [Hymenobacter sp. BT559]
MKVLLFVVAVGAATTLLAPHAQAQSTPPASAVAPLSVAGQALFAGSPTPQLVARQFAFTEGPAVDRQGNIFFTDQPNDKIWKYDVAGKLSVFLSPSGRANGLYFDKKGNLLACADAQGQLWSISPDGKTKVLLDKVNGQQLNGPNDLWVSPLGGIFFTDPYYKRDYWPAARPAPIAEYVYYLAPGAKQPVAVETSLKKPNGLIGSPDGKLLYVADIGAGKTYRYRLGAKGELLDKQLFVAQGSDGMTLDEQGNVYLTGQGVTIYSPAGERLAHLDVPAAWTANLCFGGKELRTLFITASEAVYTVPMRVRGIR